VIVSLSLSGLGVIDEADLEFGPGLTVLTGETGAGKTMVVTSLQLLMGQRASSDLVRAGASRARVTAYLEVDPRSPAAERVAEAGGELDDDLLTAVRTIAAEGRSRGSLGGVAVPVGVLGDVMADLVAVHGQRDQGRLAEPVRQRELLDRFGGLASSADEVGRLHARLRALKAERDDLRAHDTERLREAETLRFGLAEIRAVSPTPDEDKLLQADEQRLAHAVELKQAAFSTAATLSDDDRAIVAQLADLQRTLDAARQHDPNLAVLADRLSEVGYLVSDLASDLISYAGSVDADPGLLAQLQDRRAALAPLLRKYGPDMSQVLLWAAEAEQRLAEVGGADDRLDALDSEIDSATSEWLRLATALSEQRAAAAAALSAAVTSELSALAMPDAEFSVEVRRGPTPMASGLDDVLFLLRPHRGSDFIAVHRGASGGELSRVMLALEVVLTDADPVATLVFDEVDAGVGGSAAVEVGRRLARLARQRQVLVVTHLPQVAAFADHHWVVQKSTSGDVTSSGLRSLDDDSRVKELTRMLAGLTESSSGQAHAEELLSVARAAR
jgi:DNA repair protein RecN (Recombination protein N)